MSAAGGSWASRPHALSRSAAAPQRTRRARGDSVDGTPCVVNREQVAFVREEWRVVDRWWTEEPVDRRYYEVVLESGQNMCVYRDRDRGCWFTQRGLDAASCLQRFRRDPVILAERLVGERLPFAGLAGWHDDPLPERLTTSGGSKSARPAPPERAHARRDRSA